jgi:hypothetical protein
VSSEVVIVCDVCKKQIYRSDSPIHAQHDFDRPSPNAPRGTKMRVKPMRAEPAPGHAYGRVFVHGPDRRSPTYDVQTCSAECTIFAAFDPLIDNRDSIVISFRADTADIGATT